MNKVVLTKLLGGIILDNQQDESSRLDMPAIISNFEYKPLISVIMPLTGRNLKLFKASVMSLQAQTYSNWELCAVYAGPGGLGFPSRLRKVTDADKRIRLYADETCSTMPSALNKAIEIAEGEFITHMACGDKFTYDALFWVVDGINSHPGTGFIYADECSFYGRNKYSSDNFICKPDWSPALLLNYNYIGHPAIYKTGLIRSLGGYSGNLGLPADYDMAVRMSEIAPDILHIERILYFHRSTRNAADTAIIDKRMHIPENLTVSIIIPSDNLQNLTQCIKDIRHTVTYPCFEIVVVTNECTARELAGVFPGPASPVICLYDNKGPFNFSDKCNKGAAAASGSALLFFNDDAMPATEQWLERLLEAVMLPGAGAAGPVMIWSSGMIQSAGLITGTQSMCDNAFGDGYNYYSKPSAIYGFHLLRDVSLLSGACIMIRKEAFGAVGGFDAENFSNAFSDMDICFRLGEAGYRCVCTPYAAVVHDTKNTWRIAGKQDELFPRFLHRWCRKFERDPYFTDSMKDLYYQPYPFPFARFYCPETPAVKKQGGREILFVAHNIQLVGAPVVLLHMIRAAIGSGDRPVLFCSEDGLLLQDFLNLGVIVIIDKCFQYEYPVFEYFARNFDLVVVNTLGCGKAVSCLNGSLPPVLWWIHECPLTLKAYKYQIPGSIAGNINVYAVSEYSAKSLSAAGLSYNYHILSYGIPDAIAGFGDISRFDAYPEDMTVFLTVGTVYYRKGHDILLKAIDLLSDEIKSKSLFIFIGSGMNSDNIYKKLLKKKNKCKNIICFDTMHTDELFIRYQQADCLLLPSRDDPLPVVAVEAMMFSKPVICSDKTGTADYITSYRNGIVYPCNEHSKLAECIKYAVGNKDLLKQMGSVARTEIYEKFFTMDVFRDNVMKAFKETQEREISCK